MSKKAGPVTESRLQISLFWRFASASRALIPNYTPVDWWECDCWRLLKSGYTAEYEIKLTKADFLADSNKSRQLAWQHERGWANLLETRKHDLLWSGDSMCPNTFYFVLPKDLDVEVPEWAGEIRFVCGEYRKFPILLIEKRAPFIHKEKKEFEEEKLRNTFYWRYWGLKEKYEKERIMGKVG